MPLQLFVPSVPDCKRHQKIGSITRVCLNSTVPSNEQIAKQCELLNSFPPKKHGQISSLAIVFLTESSPLTAKVPGREGISGSRF